MTLSNNDTEPDTENAGQPVPEDASEQPESNGQEPDPGEPDPRNAEAAKWRTKFQAAKAGLEGVNILTDALKGQVGALQRQVVDQHVLAQFASAEDFHRGANMADLLDDAGSVDFAKVDAAAQQILAANPHYRRSAFAPMAAPASTVNSDKSTNVVPGGQKPSWSDVFEQGKKM